MNLFTSFATRAKVLTYLLTRRDWVTPVAKITYDSPYGFEIPDINATRDPLFWWQDARLPEGEFTRLVEHDYTRGQTGIPPWNSEPEVSAFLAKWIMIRSASNVLELGCFTGFTTAHLALALATMPNPTRLTCVDGNPSYAALAKENVADLIPKPPLVRFHTAFSTDPTLKPDLNPPYDLIFLDTSHAQQDTTCEIATFLPLLSPGGTLALHDAIKWPGVRRSVDAVPATVDKIIFATTGGNGLALLLP